MHYLCTQKILLLAELEASRSVRIPQYSLWTLIERRLPTRTSAEAWAWWYCLGPRVHAVPVQACLSHLFTLCFTFKMKDAPPDNLMPLGGSKVEFELLYNNLKPNRFMSKTTCNVKLYKMRLVSTAPLIFGGSTYSDEWEAPCNAILFIRKIMVKSIHDTMSDLLTQD